MDAITRDIQQSYQNLLNGNDPNALQRYLATTPYSADQLAAATGYNAADLQTALSSARAAQPAAQQWTPATSIQQQGGITQVRGGDPGASSSGISDQQRFQLAQFQGYGGSLADWQAQQAAYRQQAQQDMAANPGVVAGGYANQGQMQAVQQPAALGGSTTAGGTSGGMFQDVNVNSYSQNPYLAQMGSVLTNRVTDNLNRNIMPSIRSNAIAAGGIGGSRQGVVEANAMKDANQTISDALTGAYFQDFTNQMNRNLQQYGMNQGFYTAQRGQDLAQTQLGANLFQQGNTGLLGQGQGIYGLGTTQQQAPWNTINQGTSAVAPWANNGSTSTVSGGGGASGFLGGALGAGQLWGLIK